MNAPHMRDLWTLMREFGHHKIVALVENEFPTSAVLTTSLKQSLSNLQTPIRGGNEITIIWVFRY